MLEILAIAGASVGLASQITDMIGSLKGTAAKSAVQDLEEKILELRENLSKLKSKAIDLADENEDLKRKLKKLEEAKDERPKLLLKDQKYYSAEGDGPFCMACYDAGKQVRLREEQNPMFRRQFGAWQCTSCKQRFK